MHNLYSVTNFHHERREGIAEGQIMSSITWKKMYLFSL